MKKIRTIALALIAFLFVMGIFLYPLMPEEMVSHWNVHGEVDGYMSKFWGLFLMPFVALALFMIFLLAPQIDPLKKNIQKFRSYFDQFIIVFILFLSYLYILTIAWNFGSGFNMNRMLAPAFGILFFYCGVLIEKSKRNWFIGIRTPWTLSSALVWDKTHRIGGKLFKLSGIISLLGVIIPQYAIIIILFPILLSSVYVFIYSFFEYQKEAKKSGD